MTDRPFVGGADTAVGPTPGYYPDPSVPGFVRYWGGTAWVPGTSRPAPAEGELLEPPRFAARHTAPISARYVPPPVVAPSMTPSMAPAATPSLAPSMTTPLQAMTQASLTETGPVFFDQTSAGASFALATYAELELRPSSMIEPRVESRVDPQVGPQVGPVVAATVAAAPDREPVPAPAPELVPMPAPQLQSPQPSALQDDASAAYEAHLAAAGTGWQADPQAQRGLLEREDAPRWVSWGVLSAAPAEPLETAPPATEPEPEPVRAAAAEVSAELASAPAAAPVDVPAAVPVSVPTPAKAAAPSLPPSPSLPRTGVARTGVPSKPASRKPAQRKPASRKPAPRPAAGLGRRLVARLLDSAVIAVVAVAAGLPLLSSVVEHVQSKLEQARTASSLTGREVQVWVVDPVVIGKVGVLLGVLVLVGVLYEVLPTARTGQTFGKRLAGVRVIDAGAPGRRAESPSLGRSTARWIVRQLSTLLVIGLVWPLLDRGQRRGWHDRAARTRVVRA